MPFKRATPKPNLVRQLVAQCLVSLFVSALEEKVNLLKERVANPRLVVAELGTLRDRALLNTSLSGVVSDAARLVLVLRG